MEQNNKEFNGVGKRMPYNVPDDFFATLEENVMRDVTATEGRRSRRAHMVKMFTRISIAAAAVFVLVMGLKALYTSKTVDSVTAMEQAFVNLSAEDQDYLLEVYQEDIFLEDEDITNEI